MSFILKMPQRTFAYVASALLVANCLLCFFAIQRATSINDFFFFHFGVLGLMLCPLLAAYFFLRLRAPDTTPTRGLLMSILLLLSFALLSLARQTPICSQVDSGYHSPALSTPILAVAGAHACCSNLSAAEYTPY